MDIPNPHYETIGGELGVRKLVDAFYLIMDTDPKAARIRQLHPNDLHSSKEKLFKFLSGWLGGPPLYVEEYGHPRLRQRHLPFSIGDAERDQWLECMQQALRQCNLEGQLEQQLNDSFSKTADFLRNHN
jgi:hemoglobin